MTEPIFLIVDLFCGAGGTSTGFANAELNGSGIAKVIACVNHDKNAIKSHWLNHPEVKHFEEDIRTLDLTELISIVVQERARHPYAYVVLWASLECTNFSKAKGGQPRDADSRTLADHLERYITAIDPEYVQIENVVEFMSWGPLDVNGKPVSRKNGSDWMRWKNSINELGYYNEWKELNSANFGAYTSRNRLFGCFAKEGLPIAWPQPTHSKNPSKFSMHGDLKKWMAVKEVLDFSDEGLSIFNRKKDLSDKTLERIYAGLLKFVAKGDTSFLSKYYSGSPSDKNKSVDSPADAITTIDHHSLINTSFICQRNSGNPKNKVVSVDGPARTITSTGGNQDLVQPEFLTQYYSGGKQLSSIEDPCPVLPTKDRVSLIQPEYFIDKHFGKSQNQSINEPAGTIMPNDKHRLVEVDHFIMPTNFDNTPKSIEDPLPTTADRHHHYIVNPSHGGNMTSIDAPCPVIVARQDKAPLYLVECDGGSVSIPVYSTDSAACIKIKEFMVAYNLIDIKMRMLRVTELLRIQGFPDKYQLHGNQSDQKKFIGNSVVPHVVKAWAEAMANRIIENNKKVA